MPIHIMLCDHGDLGLAYRETDPDEADEASIIATMLAGECDMPRAVIAFDTHTGWSRDVSEDIARKLEDEAAMLGKDLPPNTRAFVERHRSPERHAGMTDTPSLVPEKEVARIGKQYFLPEALELIQRVKHRSELSNDEIVMLALTAAQAALAKHVEPGNRDAEETLNTILRIIDHDEVVQATLRRLHKLLRQPAPEIAKLGPWVVRW